MLACLKVSHTFTFNSSQDDEARGPAESRLTGMQVSVFFCETSGLDLSSESSRFSHLAVNLLPIS